MDLDELKDLFGPHYKVSLDGKKVTLERNEEGNISYRKTERELTDYEMNLSAWAFFNTVGSEMLEAVHNVEQSTDRV